jgi:hypothetical protein
METRSSGATERHSDGSGDLLSRTAVTGYQNELSGTELGRTGSAQIRTARPGPRPGLQAAAGAVTGSGAAAVTATAAGAA